MNHREVIPDQKGQKGDVITVDKRVRKRPLWRKLLYIFLALLLVAIAVAIIWLGPLVEWYVEDNDSDVVGRRIEMDDLGLKIFTGGVTADNVVLYEVDGTTPFARIDRIDADVEMTDIFGGCIYLSHVHLTRPYLNVEQDGEIFNFNDLVEFIVVNYVASNPEEDEEDDDPWEIVIKDVTIEDGHIEYLDQQLDKRWSVTAMDMHTDEFKMGDALSYVNASLNVNERAALEGVIALNYDSLDFDFEGSIKEFDISETYPYVAPYLNVNSIGGIVATTAHLKGNLNDVMAMDIDGSIHVDELSVVDADGYNLFSSTTLGGEIDQINVAQEKFLFNTLYATGYASRFAVDNDGHTNFDNLLADDMQISVETPEEALDDDSYDVYEEVVITNAEGETISSMELRIGTLTLEGGSFDYYDGAMDQRWSLAAIDVDANDFSMDDQFTYFDTSLQINDGATLEGVLAVNCESLDFDFQGTIKGFDISDTYNYWTPYLNVESVDGVAEVTAHITGNVDNIMAMNIGGSFLMDNLSIKGPDGGNVLSSTSFGGDIEQINIDSSKFVFSTLHAKGYSSQFILASDGSTNFDNLLPEDTQFSVETTSESLGNDIYDIREEVRITNADNELLGVMDVRIGKLTLEDGNIYYADNTLHKKFAYDISNINVSGKELNLEGYNDISIRAMLPKQGNVVIRWEGALNDFYNQSIMATLTNVDLKTLEPYMENYTAFPIESGNMTFRSMNVITNGELNGVNQLGTYNFKLGNKDKSMDVDFNLPLKMGVYVLTDKDGHIDLELPVTGNVESPEFSYRKTILKVIGNLLLKIVASPFDWMSGDKQEAFRNINFDPLDPTLTAEHYARIDKMAETLKGDEELSVCLKQSLNYHKAEQEVANLNLKMAYYNSKQTEEGKRLDMLDFAQINNMTLADHDVHAFADSMLVARGIDPAYMSMAAKARTLYGEYAARQLTSIAQRRSRIVTDYIKFQHPDLREGAITVKEVTVEDVVGGNSRKSRFVVTLIIDGEEMEMNSTEDGEEASNEEAPQEAIVEEENNNLANDALEENNE